jgi:poly(3-hydroxybutyrate) depolymerase
VNTTVLKLDGFMRGSLRGIYYYSYAILVCSAFAPGCGSDNGSTQPVAGTDTSGVTPSGLSGSSASASRATAGSAAVTIPSTGTGGVQQTGSAGSSGKSTVGTAGNSGTAGKAGKAGGGAGSAGTPSDAGSSADTGAEPLPSPGCSGGTIKPGNTTETMQSGGSSKQYVQHVPSSYDGKTPFSLLVDLHGGTYDGPRWDTRNGKGNPFKEMSETEHFILLSPTASASGMWSAADPETPDGQFIRDLVDLVKKNACIDTRRVYATGCSMGGAMSFWLACYASDYIAAVVPMCGTAFFDVATKCKPKRPVSEMFIMGSQDSLNCWEEPRTSVGNPCASEILAAFKTINGCTDEAEKTHNGLCLTHDKCKENTEASVCLLNTTHMGIYEATDMNVYQEGWKFLKRFYIH